MTLAMTEPQERLWRFIKSCERSPSFVEMSQHMYGHPDGKGAIHQLVVQLEKRRYITRDRRIERSIVAVDIPTYPDIRTAKTSELLAELERRGILLTGCAA